MPTVKNTRLPLSEGINYLYILYSTYPLQLPIVYIVGLFHLRSILEPKWKVMLRREFQCEKMLFEYSTVSLCDLIP